MKDNLISIILPTYNGAKYIEKSIESIRNQTYQKFELIIVDDASTDKTPEIVDKYAEIDFRIKVIHNPKNCRLPKSLNIGFSNAKGKYFTWTSDDNIYKEDAFEKMLNVFNRNPQIDLVYADMTLINERGRETGRRIGKNPDAIYQGNFIGACFLYRKEVHFALGGYKEEWFLMEDYDFWIRAYEYPFHFYYLPENLYYYREHKKSLTSKKLMENQKLNIKYAKFEIRKINKEISRKFEIKSDIYGRIAKNLQLNQFSQKKYELLSSFYHFLSKL